VVFSSFLYQTTDRHNITEILLKVALKTLALYLMAQPQITCFGMLEWNIKIPPCVVNIQKCENEAEGFSLTGNNSWSVNNFDVRTT